MNPIFIIIILFSTILFAEDSLYIVNDSLDMDYLQADSFPEYEIIVTSPKSFLKPSEIIPEEEEKEIGLTNNIYSFQQNLPGVGVSGDKTQEYSVQGSLYNSNLMMLNDIPISFPTHLDIGFPKNASVLNVESIKSIRFYQAAPPAMYGFKTSSILEVEYQKPEKPFEADISFGTLDYTVLTKMHKERHALSLGFRHGWYYSLKTIGKSQFQISGKEAGYDNFQVYYSLQISPDINYDILWITANDHVGSLPLYSASNTEIVAEQDGAIYSASTQMYRKYLYDFLCSSLSIRNLLNIDWKIAYGLESADDTTQKSFQYEFQPIGYAASSSLNYYQWQTGMMSFENQNLRVMGIHKIPGHSLDFGIDFTLNKFLNQISNRFYYNYPVELDTSGRIRKIKHERGVYINDKIVLSHGFEANIGARIDQYAGLRQILPSAKAGLQLNAPNNNVLYIKTGSYNQSLPNQDSADGVTQAYHLLLGWDWKTSSEVFGSNIETYIKREINVPDYINNPILYSYASSTHNQTIYGISPAIRWHPLTPFDLSFNYSYLYPYSVNSNRKIESIRPHTVKAILNSAFGEKRKLNILVKGYYCSGLPFDYLSVKNGILTNPDGLTQRFPDEFRWDLGLYVEEAIPNHVCKKMRIYYNMSNSMQVLPQSIFFWTQTTPPKQILVKKDPDYLLELGVKIHF